MRGSFDCELRVFTQDTIKRIAEKEYAMNITCGHTPFAQAHMLTRASNHKLARFPSTCACTHVYTAVNCQE